VTSIRLANAISSGRVRSGISAICARYIRIGSLPALAGALVVASSRRGAAGLGVPVPTAAVRPALPVAGGTSAAEARVGGASTRSMPFSSSATSNPSIFSGSTASSGR